MTGMPIPLPPQQYDPTQVTLMMQIIEQRLQDLERPVATGYATTNVAVPTRSLDVITVTLPQLAEVVATIINDLKTQGRLA